MKVLVTGGAGFIGSHIVEELVAKGYEAVVVDNLVSGSILNINKNNAIYIMDIRETTLQQVFMKEKPEIVIHAAAQVDVRKSLDDPTYDAVSNILGTINVLECCRIWGVRKLIYSSSAAVYGNPQYLGIDEEHPARPISNYGVSKYAAEKYIQSYHALYGLDYTILRYSNVFGPRQGSSGEGGVIYKFLNNIFNGRQPVIYGSGEQTRDFIFADDVARANLLAVDRGSKGIFNISTGQRHSINNMLSIICRLVSDNISPLRAGAIEGDILHSCLDNRKARDMLRWKPTYTMEEGLLKTIKYYRGKYCDRIALKENTG